jgi:phenylalanyl-tRNA synthetase beta chain
MQLVHSWLREWVHALPEPSALASRLTLAGHAVDAVTPLRADFHGVVVARVESVQAHPDAARLSVCRVAAAGASQQVVCGAPNVRAGMLAAWAPPGARLPGGRHVEHARLRGVDSAGMLLSAAELGAGDDAAGLLELDGVHAAADLAAALALPDHTYELDLTPNRGDCLSVRGLAREVAALLGASCVPPAMPAVAAGIADVFPVRVEAPAACPRYLGRVLRGADLSRPSPLWLRERLRRAGLRPIDAVVDVTNYVMLELGQPLHAFDLRALRGGIVVRLAAAGERLRLLDGRDVALRPDTLVIADADGPVAMAGIMGGDRSGIDRATTRDVFLESAFFTPAAIAGRPRGYGMNTDASQRYERGVDPALPALAIERATALLLGIVGGAAGPVVDTTTAACLPAARLVALRRERLARLAGCTFADEEVTGALSRLGLEVSARADGSGWLTRVPSHRFDLGIEEDLVEEVLRLHGFDRVPDAMPVTAMDLATPPDGEAPLARLRERLRARGYHEAITYSFIDAASQDLFDPGVAPVALDNPLSAEMAVMRTSLLPGLVQAVVTNLNRQQPRVRLFECGRCFVPQAGGGVRQVMRLGGVVAGSRHPEGWASARAGADFFDVKGDVESLLDAALAARFGFVAATRPALHPGQCARVALAREGEGGDATAIGWVGTLHPALAERLGIDVPVAAFELDLDALAPAPVPRFVPISAFPAVRRDLALLVGREVPAATIEATVRDACGELLTELTVFDVYAGEGIDSTMKSVALGLTLQHRSRTLDERIVGDAVGAVLKALQDRVGAVQR